METPLSSASPAALLRSRVDRIVSRISRADTLPGIQFSEPTGDPGLFGPDSAIWYVHAHYSAVPGGVATLLMQALEPGMGYAAAHDSKFLTEPLERLGRSASFVGGMTFAGKPVTERLVRMVRAMQGRVGGEMPDGRRYSAGDPHSLRVAAALFPLGIGAAHRRYHPRPLRGSDLDAFVADWAVISEAIGATDVPRTWDAACEYAASVVPTLALTTGAEDFRGLIERSLTQRQAIAPAGRVTLWGIRDLLQPWARRLYRIPDPSPAQVALARSALFTAINSVQLLTGEPTEVAQARKRIADTSAA